MANTFFMGCINPELANEAPWEYRQNFMGSSYHVNPRGEIIDIASEDKEELLVSTLDLDMIEEVRKHGNFQEIADPKHIQK